MFGILEAVFHTVIAMVLLFCIALTIVTIIDKLASMPACGAKNELKRQIEIRPFV